MGRRPAARGLPWVRVVSVWDVMVSVWRPLGGRSKRLVSVLRPTLGLGDGDEACEWHVFAHPQGTTLSQPEVRQSLQSRPSQDIV